jgi:predicted secreted acid phosphatase
VRDVYVRCCILLGCLGQLATCETFAKPPADFSVPATKPADINLVDGLRFSRSSECRHQFKEAVKNAKLFCAEYERNHPGERKIAIVSDIDETLLDNREALTNKTDIDLNDWRNWIDEARAPTLKVTAHFLKWARKKGYAIFLVTGRHEHGRPATVINLVKDGVAYDGLMMRDNEDYGPAENGKVKMREAIEKMGFKIVVNIGDQDSDLVGGFALDCEKLPNRMYFIP